MDSSTKKTYILLQSLFSLDSLLSNPSSQSITLGNKTITFLPHEENDYFYLGVFIEEDRSNDNDIYNEILVRVWKDDSVEVFSVRQAHLGFYIETSALQSGIEIPNASNKSEANKYFVEWLTRLKNEYGSLILS